MTELTEALSNYLLECRVSAYLAQSDYHKTVLRLERLDTALRAALDESQEALLDSFLLAQCHSVSLELHAMCHAAFAAGAELTH